MKLTAILLSAALALGVAAIDPEAGNDVEVRDFSGESLNEFDARDEELEERTYNYNPCKGKNVEYKTVGYKKECVCTLSGQYYDKWNGCQCKKGYEYSDKYYKCIKKCEDYEVYNPKGYCEKPFTCKGDHVTITDGDYGKKYCKCDLSGQYYNDKTGCACKHGYEYSEKYYKCIKKCEDYEVYNPKGYCEKPFSCKGDHVTVEEGDYGKKYCKCELSGQYYNDKTGCACKWGKEYSTEFQKCIPKCEYGYEYNSKTDKCEKPFTCKGDHVSVAEGDYGKKYCKCELEGQYYSSKNGCECKHGYEYSEKHFKCIPDCKHYEEYNPTTGKCEKPFTCKGKNVKVELDGYGKKYCKCQLEGQTYSSKHGCQCKWGESYSTSYKKCIPDCKHYEVYNPTSGKCEKPFTCKGKNVKVELDGYGKKYCKCTLDHQEYNKHTGCVCSEGYFYDKNSYGCKPHCEVEHSYWNGHKCACERGYYDWNKQCLKPPTCDGYGSYFDHTSWKCVCKNKGETYYKNKGCVKSCGQNEKLVWEYGNAKCICKDGYKKTKWGCKKDDGYGY